MVRNTRSVCKTCPECDQQAAVASKACSSCGFDFFKAKRKVDEILKPSSLETQAIVVKPKRSTPTTPNPEQKANSKKLITEETRRTTRIRREKPQFYDSRQYDKKPKRLERPKRANKPLDDLKDGLHIGNSTKDSKMKKKLKSKDELIDDNINMMDKLSEEKQEYAEFLLAEINRKLIGVQWRPAL